MDNTPTLEETLLYNQAKAILRTYCVVLCQLAPCLKTISEYEEKFNILEKDRFKSDYITRSVQLNGRAVLLDPLYST